METVLRGAINEWILERVGFFCLRLRKKAKDEATVGGEERKKNPTGS
jgi:hypothetical protein